MNYTSITYPSGQIKILWANESITSMSLADISISKSASGIILTEEGKSVQIDSDAIIAAGTTTQDLYNAIQVKKSAYSGVTSYLYSARVLTAAEFEPKFSDTLDLMISEIQGGGGTVLDIKSTIAATETDVYVGHVVTYTGPVLP